MLAGRLFPACGLALVAATAGGAVGPIRSTTGAAPGYVADSACASCHESIAQSYREVGMARSFSRPRRDGGFEPLDGARFTHAPSKRTYEMRWRGERLVMRRFQIDAAGRQRNLIEQPVDWVLGSGNHSRTYLYRIPNGELYQLPLAWYAEGRQFAMAPGYDRPDHDELARRVRRECMFCHNAYPEVATGSDERGAPAVFPAELPHGTGCQRCHGPGARHLEAAMGGAENEEVRAAIVNPAKLPAARRDDVCYQCHLQPSVAIPGTRRFGRPDYSFRPGEALGDYLVPMDVGSGPSAPVDRFEINHHPYRLRASRCAAASGERLSCLTCHDPHRKVPAAERAAHYRRACLGCHPGGKADTIHRAVAGFPTQGALAADCASCHMPRRRPHDVVRVVMTDHRIGIYRDLERGLLPLAESEPDIVELRLYGLAPQPSGEEAELYRALAGASAAGVAAPSALAALRRLAPDQPRARDAWLEITAGSLRAGDLAAAEAGVGRLLGWRPQDPLALDWRAVLLARQGRGDEALRIWRRLAVEQPLQAETQFNLGRMLLARGEPASAAAALERATTLAPYLVPAWYRLAEARRGLDDRAGEIAALERAVAIEPGQGRAYVALAAALRATQRRAEAEELLAFARTVVRQPATLDGR